MKNASDSIKQAIEIAGGQAALARKCGVAQPTVFAWLKKGFVPPRKVLLVEQITGVSRCRLNPMIYPQEPSNN
jgi:DNA-binding transcriptional regulator YdaS (Cro superfamily)